MSDDSGRQQLDILKFNMAAKPEITSLLLQTSHVVPKAEMRPQSKLHTADLNRVMYMPTDIQDGGQ